ncbi:16S rRNA (guanine(527)-N(7))-methyltransferase RsmG [Aliikangiella coralliicola]|uniref:Ribosomal RNA small subunit methyltransferase G n=1 Tax=Aliikangiella coralliicola TaxID=2592383 RepID=A0A545UGK7_9GAMM|nr:16S rRNA (guanine(527)-N(7))-methyltransferase RsmG [Aliikangiella coralliicola]TQV88600.1 16S rRNA (guanine(527)-N(7))-methyltransferase RsmG [Aliikangiella coralliicola]
MRQILMQGVESLQLNLTSHQLDQLMELLTELLKWNKTFNLTAITDETQALKLHLLDSLSIVPFWRFQKTLDVGTGSGFPGLPLAIALPDKEFHLLDSNSKKIRFIRQQIHHLKLKNVVAHHCRIEAHQLSEDEQGYDAIVSRAFASLADMVGATRSLLAENGRWMAMKGVYSEQEVEQLPSWARKEDVLSLNIPGLDVERCLIELTKRND